MNYPRRAGGTSKVIASARGLVKTYGAGGTAVHALGGVDVDFARGELTAIMGPSGSGKSTLMHCMAGLDTVTAGRVLIEGEDVGAMNQRQLTRLRRTRLGFIFQAYNLIPTLTAAENITLPLDIARRPVDQAHFTAVVTALGLQDRLDHRPRELSGGQQQRVAARVPWSRNLRSSSPTSRPGTWTPRPPVSCWPSCVDRSTNSTRPW